MRVERYRPTQANACRRSLSVFLPGPASQKPKPPFYQNVEVADSDSSYHIVPLVMS